MLESALEFVKKLQKENKVFEYTERPDQPHVVSLKFNGKYCRDITVRVFFDLDGRSAAFRCFSICKFEEDSEVDAVLECNKLNNEYRWTRFSLDKDMDVCVSADAIFSKLMGDEVEPRRNFIEENARFVQNLDV